MSSHTRRVVLSGALLGAALLLAPGAARAQDVGLALGSRPAPVVIQDLAGRPADLGRWIGRKPVLLEFWATWCPLCRALEPRLAAARKAFGQRVAVVTVAVGVNESPRSIKRHLEDHPIGGPVLWDGDGKATRAFEAPSTSYIVVLDRSGRVVYTGAGADQDVEAAIRKALPPRS